MSTITIRRATENDASALSLICLLTADAGRSAEHLHDFGELPGFVYAVPYVKLPTTWGFVMVDSTPESSPTSATTTPSKPEVVGYVLGSTDTRAYEAYAAEHWWPMLAEKYTMEYVKGGGWAVSGRSGKPADERYVRLLRDMPVASEACVRFSKAHLHIDILEEYQRKGWGKKLIAKAVEFLKEETDVDGVWIGMDPRNENARAFYEKLGFERIEGADENQMGLRFSRHPLS